MGLSMGIHDQMLIEGVMALPEIVESLDTANVISCVKELYAMGEISRNDYIDLMTTLLMDTGYDVRTRRFVRRKRA